jgi:hypothetical protein
MILLLIILKELTHHLKLEKKDTMLMFITGQ